MKKFFVLGIICSILTGADAYSAGARTPTAGARGRTPVATQNASSGATAVAPRGRTGARAASNQVSGAKNVSGGTAVLPGQKTNTAVAPKSSGVSARAATNQKAINTNTKIAGATANTVVSEECKNKYYGCMDSFCMLDNTNGGRCVCSNKHAEYETILAEIQKLDQQSYEMATTGVERINMGDTAADVDAMVNKMTKSMTDAEAAEAKKKARSLKLQAWDTESAEDADDLFVDAAEDDLSSKTGDALYSAVTNICVKQIPECSSSMSMLKMMYAQQIKADCGAYENSLKKQKQDSAKKLATAQQAMREAALEQYQNANKYDLGQCTIRFKECMQTTAGCGDDFSKCTSIVARENQKTKNYTKNKQAQEHVIKTGATSISITASTYDTLLGKKTICETVTKQCQKVKDKVWDAFLLDVAPSLKSAELIAESDLRMSCIGNISECFQKACKDTMDPNDPDGSYDMCLTRPETMRSVCKVQIDPCEEAEPKIFDYVKARLASMRVDACTKEVKNCLTADDRCGKDYANCVGLDTDSIIRMCPYEKLVGCQKMYGSEKIGGEDVYNELATMVEGIMLNIDNSFLASCQKALDEAMVKVCGDTESCNNLVINQNVGSRSLQYKICHYTSKDNSLEIDYGRCRTDVGQIPDTELGKGGAAIAALSGVLDGTIYWENISFGDDGKLVLPDMSDSTPEQKSRVESELTQLQTSINNAISAIESDPTVQYCMTGREVQGMKVKGKKERTNVGEKQPRFPDLSKQTRMIIATAALNSAKENYYKKYDELNTKMQQDYVTLNERISKIAGENEKDARRETARKSCLALSSSSTLPKTPLLKQNTGEKVGGAILIALSALAVPFTFGASTAGIAGGAALVAHGNKLRDYSSNYKDSSTQQDFVSSQTNNQWNYKETVTSTFEWETLNCHRCIRAQQCTKTRREKQKDRFCQTWAEPTETCKDIQF